MNRPFCPTTRAILLLGVRVGSPAIVRVPDARCVPPGRVFTPQPLVPIDEQLIKLAQEILGARMHGTVSICQDYTDLVLLDPNLPSEHPDAAAVLYLATCDLDGMPTDVMWPSFPELLRAMPKDRARLPYLRAFQVLAGGLQMTTKAIDVAELAKYFPDEPKH